MIEKEFSFRYMIYPSAKELEEEDAVLLNKAKEALKNAYAPYSGFFVAAAILLDNGEMVTGTNQENAAFPVGICAEGTAMSATASLFPDMPYRKIAITAKSSSGKVSSPVPPCGICRQRLLEYEHRTNRTFQIILAGEEGEVYKIKTAESLLPLQFSPNHL